MKKVMSMKYSYEIYCFLLFLIGIISWSFSSVIGLALTVLMGVFLMFYFKDVNYLLPTVLNASFLRKEDFFLNEAPVFLIASIVLLIVSMIAYLIWQKRIKIDKLTISFLALGILSLATIPLSLKVESFAYLIHVNWIFYFFILLFFVSGKNKDMEKLKLSLGYLGVLIAFELIINALIDKRGIEASVCNPLSLGWGICNEAGIMLLTVIPFSLYQICLDKKIHYIELVKIIVMFLGVFLTGSRGAYLFGFLLMIVLLPITFIKAQSKKNPLIILSAFVGLLLTVSLLNNSNPLDIIKKVFASGLDSSGRFQLYKDAFGVFTQSVRSFFLGAGYINAIDGRNRIIVYHSTLFETLACLGITGLIILLTQFWFKYKLVLHKDLFSIITLIGFVTIDLYGLIDNTYHMFYYMIPLSVILAYLGDQDKEPNMEKNEM